MTAPSPYPQIAEPTDVPDISPAADPAEVADDLAPLPRDQFESVIRDRSMSELCEAAAHQVASTLPGPWVRAWLQVESTDGIALIYCWYQPGAGVRPRYHDLPPQALDLLCQIFRALRRVTVEGGEPAWNEAAMTLDAVQGTYTVDYDRVDVAGDHSPAAQLDRHIAWQERHLAAS